MIAINSANSPGERSQQFAAERLALLEATSDGLDVYAHFGSYFGCEGQPQLNRNYASPFPLDKRYRKSFRLSYGDGGQIVFNDFAAQLMGDCFSFVMQLLGYSFKEAVRYIKDSVLNNWSPVNLGSLLQRVGRPRLIEKPLLSINTWLRQPNEGDSLASDRYDLVGITPELRAAYHCYYLGGALVGNRFGEDGQPKEDYTIYHSAQNPLYGYWYPSTDKWKLNRPQHPNKDFRWGPNNVRGTDAPIFGQHLLPELGHSKQLLGILGPGQRDTMAVAGLTRCWAGALSSESAHITAEQFGLLSAHFEHLAFFTDNDEAGLKGAAYLQKTWGLRCLNDLVHPLGENDLCAWLKTSTGQRPEFRQQVGRDLVAFATAA